MRVFRIGKNEFIKDLSGYGAKLYGGRWNRPGLAAIYTSQHLSLALLELIVHFESEKALLHDYSYISFEIPNEEIQAINESDIPAGEIAYNEPKLWNILDQYFLGQKAMAIEVPSIILPQEKNIIINPLHPLVTEIASSGLNAKPMAIDQRFFKKASSTL